MLLEIFVLIAAMSYSRKRIKIQVLIKIKWCCCVCVMQCVKIWIRVKVSSRVKSRSHSHFAERRVRIFLGYLVVFVGSSCPFERERREWKCFLTERESVDESRVVWGSLELCGVHMIRPCNGKSCLINRIKYANFSFLSLPRMFSEFMEILNLSSFQMKVIDVWSASCWLWQINSYFISLSRLNINGFESQRGTGSKQIHRSVNRFWTAKYRN